ncbi:hypothetical protein [Microbacterium sp. W4I20]|uniref:hypothetical protein n=1 Tax=Microbacterium sp. W4I20 TaxID=3042262 RepID=UPI0027D8A890|nr:hypothetical protein [Microbacterium sp. W4I20]
MTDGTNAHDEPGSPEPSEDFNEPTAQKQADEQSETDEQILEDAEELIKDPAPLLRKVRLDPEALSRLGDGFRAMREGVSDFFVAGDRSAGRTKDTADRVIKLIEKELDREGLTAKERLEFIEAGERMAGTVGDSESSTRAGNERTFGKIATIAAGATVAVLVLGYLGKDGKLPPMPSA